MNYQLLKVRKSFFSHKRRGSGHGTAHYPFFKIDFERLARYCEKNNAVVLFKMHPFVKNKLMPDKHKQYFVDVSDFREVNDILFITDLLISDYSSLIYEYAVFKKPMIFYAFDFRRLYYDVIFMNHMNHLFR